jgi:glucokinase
VIPILLADIGGTHTRFAFAGSDGRPECIKIIDNDNFPALETAIARYLEQTATRPRAAVLAVAAPIDGGDEIAMTNRAWHFRRSALAQRFGLAALRIVNDFEAIAWALPRLTAADARPLGSLAAPAAGVKVALGPGTGLGVAALMPVNCCCTPMAASRRKPSCPVRGWCGLCAPSTRRRPMRCRKPSLRQRLPEKPRRRPRQGFSYDSWGALPAGLR